MRAPLFPLVALCLALAPQTVHAQEDDRSYLVALLEDNLSGAGRKITINGFEGALSSVASLDEMTIADDLGVWITLRDVSLDWSRSALLSGEVSVNSLTAAEIILDRMPDSGASSLPAAEAAPFALPDLPVSVRIDKIAAEKIVLGAGILGETVEGRVAATVSLVGGEGRVTFNLDRLDDGPAGFLTLDASYSNATSQLTLSLDAQEDEGGIAARLLSVPGAPSAGLTIEGSGPLDDFLAEVSLQTGGLQRLSGQVELRGQADGARNFAVDLKGDLAPVFWPEYRDFLGEALVLKAAGTSRADGRLELSEFALKAGALNAKGQLIGMTERTSIAKEGDRILSRGEGESLEIAPNTPVSMNFWGFHPSVFQEIEVMWEEFLPANLGNLKSEFYIPTVANNLIQANKAAFDILPGGKIWFGVTYTEDRPVVIEALQQLHEQGEYPTTLW